MSVFRYVNHFVLRCLRFNLHGKIDAHFREYLLVFVSCVLCLGARGVSRFPEIWFPARRRLNLHRITFKYLLVPPVINQERRRWRRRGRDSNRFTFLNRSDVYIQLTTGPRSCISTEWTFLCGLLSGIRRITCFDKSFPSAWNAPR